MGVKKTPARYSKPQLRQIEGRNAVLEAFKADTPITALFIEKNLKYDERIYQIHDFARKKKLEITQASPKKLDRLSKTSGHHQGVIAKAQLKTEPNLEKLIDSIYKNNKKPFFIILTNALYQQNLGAVIRSAECSGVDAVIVSKKSPQLTAIVERAAVGAGEYIPLIHHNLFTAIKILKDNAVKIFGAREGNNKNIFKCDFTLASAIVLGAEDKGISDPVSKLIDQFISIPLLGKIESLNLSVAASICMYEVLRQRKYQI